MNRHRIVRLEPGNRRYTLALVRFRTDDQARELAKGYRGNLAVVRETFNLQGMTTEREDVTEP